jgi:XTP/dITP diphosphohydrolase
VVGKSSPRIVFASKNRGKIKEFKKLLEGTGITLLSLDDYPDMPDVEEDGKTFFENAFKKASAISKYTGEVAVADDSGLEVDFLDGRPGIYSSRFSGQNATDEENIIELLRELKNVPAKERKAAFKCVLVIYRPDGKFESFEGTLKGEIGLEPRGSEGFGYDPVFIVPEYDRTVAELDPDVKNRISHRAEAFKKLKESAFIESI